MKKTVIIIFIFLLFPCYLYASSLTSYNSSLLHVNNTIKKFNKFSNYLNMNKNNYLCELVNNKLECIADSSFIDSGYINFDEYIIVGGIDSYLNDGIPYYTMTIENGKVKLIVGANQNIYGYIDTNLSSNNGYTRITEYIDKKTVIIGRGTFIDPWVFVDNSFPPEWTQDPDISFGQPNGTKGDNNWFRSDVTVNVVTQMPKGSIKEFKYCVTTNSTCNPNTIINDTSKIVSISEESDSNKICASIKTVADKETFICSSDLNKYNAMYKIDKTNPTCKASFGTNNFIITDIVESLSGLPANAYSWTGNTGDYSSLNTTLATEAKTYTAYVKDVSGNIGQCKATCTDWTSPSTYTTTGICSSSITTISKVSDCVALNTCTKAATISSYSCPYGTYVAGTNYCNGDIIKTEDGCDDKIASGSTYNNIASKEACSTKCGGVKLKCTGCDGGTWSHYEYSSSTKICKCRKSCTRIQLYKYSCNSGGTNQSNSWCKYTATPNYSCASGYSVSGSNCVKNNQVSCESGYTTTSTGTKQYSVYSRTCNSN